MTNGDMAMCSPELLTVITDRANLPVLEELLTEKRVQLHYMFNAMGTARSEVLQLLGLSGTEKTVLICMEPRAKALPLLNSISDRLTLSRSGSGIAFIAPISGMSMAVSKIFDEELASVKERLERLMETGFDETVDEIKFSLVVSVINKGFSEVLMEAAHGVGVLGGTIIHARRSGVEDAVKFFGVTLQAEKEIVAIVIPRAKKKELMQAITKACGINTPAHGIVISLPVESCAGLAASQE
jgi:hypothetical protein